MTRAELQELHAALGQAGFDHFIRMTTSVWQYRDEVEAVLERFGLLDLGEFEPAAPLARPGVP